MSETIKVSNTWCGLSRIKHIVVFGDSYSSVGGYAAKPIVFTSENPLGTPEDLEDLWTDGGPNWVGHLITMHSEWFAPDGDRSDGDPKPSITVFDYAGGGKTVSGVTYQIGQQFIPHIGKKYDSDWTAEDTLFVTWVGINDLAFSSDPSTLLNTLFQSQELLYNAGARNFLFIDVPPIDRSPAVLRFRDPTDNSTISRYQDWNIALRSSSTLFSSSHVDATILLYSSHTTFSHVLDDPVVHGFHEVDAARKQGKGIWMDHLHPTSKMHEIVAEDIAAFLASVESPTAGA